MTSVRSTKGATISGDARAVSASGRCQFVAMFVDDTNESPRVRFSTVDASPPGRHETTLQKHGPRPDGDRWWSRWGLDVERNVLTVRAERPDVDQSREMVTAERPRGGTVDAAVANLLLDTLTSHALEVALTVQAELDTRAAEADALRRGHVERARHRADLARRRYLAVDPDNRLVADSLEADWNDALRALQTAREDYDRATAAATATLTDELKNRIRSLATDFPTLWSNPHTQQRDRKRMVRLLVDDVTLHKTDRIHLHVRFRGGQTHSLVVAIPPTSWQARQTRTDTVAELDRLLDTHTDAETAHALNASGHRSGENKPFTTGIVVHIRRKYHLPSHADRLRAQGLLTTTELAQHLRVHPSTIKSLTKAGILNSHKANDKYERLYQRPIADDPRLTVRQGSPLRKRVLTQPTTGGAL